MAIYGVFESTNMASTKRGGARIYDVIADVDLENGMFGYLDDLADGERNVYKFVLGEKSGADPIVIDQPVWSYENDRKSKQRRENFNVPAGTICRARQVVKGDDFAISKECTTVPNDIEVDKYLSIDTSGKLIASATKPTSGFVAKVQLKKVFNDTVYAPAKVWGQPISMYECKVESVLNP